MQVRLKPHSGKIRLALIGAGKNMRGHLKRLKTMKGLELCAAADPSAEALAAAQQVWEQPLRTYSDHGRLFRHEDLDAVLISTPHSQHYEQARQALELGCHVLVEKPLTIRSSHTAKLLELAQRKRRILEVSYQRHFRALYQHARNLIAQGAIGRLNAVVGYVTQGWRHAGGWRIVPELSGGGMFMDTGSHLVAAALFVSGLRCKKVTAFVQNLELKVDLLVGASIEFEQEAVGTLLTTGTAKLHDEILAFHGDQGCLLIRQHGWQVQEFLLNNEPVQVPKSIRDRNPDEVFFAAIRKGGSYPLPVFALEVARLSEAAYASAARRRPVQVKQ